MIPWRLVKTLQSRSLSELLLVCALPTFAVVTALIALYGRATLGLGHLFYLPIVLVALASRPAKAAAAGIVSLALYELAMIVPGHTDAATLTTDALLVRLGCYLAVGVTVSLFSSHVLHLLERTLDTLDELHEEGLAEAEGERDVVTGALSSHGLERELKRRLRAGQSFALLVGAAEPPCDSAAERRRLLAALADYCPGAALARLRGRHFAAVCDRPASAEAAAATAEELAARLADAGLPVSLGWSYSPYDGDEPLLLYGFALERLQARRFARGLPPTMAPLEDVPASAPTGEAVSELSRA